MSEKTLYQRKEDAKNILEKMDEILNLSEEKKKEIFDKLEKITDFHKKGEEINLFYENVFKDLKEVIQNKENGLEITHDKAQDALNRIDELEVEVNEKKENIENIEKQAKNIGDTNEILQVELKKMLGIAIDKVLSGAFEKQENALKWGSRGWLGFFFLLILIIFLIIGYTFYKEIFDTNSLVIRFFLITPIFIIALLSFREYSKEKNKADKYAFKKVKASSLESYIELLLSRFSLKKESKFDDNEMEIYSVDVSDSESKNKILDFVLDTMKKIYSEPVFSDKILELDLKAKIKEYEMEIKIADKDIKSKGNLSSD